MMRPVPSISPRTRRALLLGLAVLCALGGLAIWSGTRVDPGLVGVVRRGTLRAQLTAAGTLRPMTSRTYRSPVAGRDVEILDLAPEGTRVNAGDLVVRIDTTDLERDLDRGRQDVRQAQLDLEVAEGEAEEAAAAVTSVVEGEGALGVAEARTRLQLAEKKRDRLRREYEQLQPLLERGFITREELRRTADDFEQADEELALVRKRSGIVLEMTHPRAQKRAALQLAQKQAQLGRARARRQEAEARLAVLHRLVDACSLYARGPGMVVYEEYLSVLPRRKIRIGDRVSSSQGIVTIPEVARMLVDASVGEAELRRVRPGQAASVRAEAFSNITLTGRVIRVGTLASASASQFLDDRRFDLVIELDPTDVDLRPEMSVRADIAVGLRENVLCVPVNAVFDQQGAFVAHVTAATGVEVRPLVLGESDDQMVEVVSGLLEGERVLLAAPGGVAAVPSGVQRGSLGSGNVPQRR